MHRREGGRPGGAADGGRRGGETPLFLVGSREARRSRVRWIGAGLAVLMAAAGAAFVGLGAVVEGDPSSRAEMRPGAAAAPAADSSSDSSSRASPPADASGAGSTFARRADSAEAALVRYRERRDLYDEGRLGCDALERAHASVDRAFLEAALTFRDRRDELGRAAGSRFDDLASRADAADRHFARTACTSER